MGIVFLLFPKSIFAQAAAGINLREIRLSQTLFPGDKVNLPDIAVVNTGEEKSSYNLIVKPHPEQTDLAIINRWINFNPQSFTLEPGETQKIETSLQIPLNSKAGRYFSYLEAIPQNSNASAATRLYFTISKPTIKAFAIKAINNIYSLVFVALILIAAILIISKNKNLNFHYIYLLKSSSIIILSGIYLYLFTNLNLKSEKVKGDSITFHLAISLCGNGVVEGSEDCEGGDLNGGSCTELGYAGGVLSCDPSCTYDLTDCQAFTPTPSATPTATPLPTTTVIATPTPTPTSPDESSATAPSLANTPTPASVPTRIIDKIKKIFPQPSPTPISVAPEPGFLPNNLKIYDKDGDGYLNDNELDYAILTWTISWRSFMEQNKLSLKNIFSINQESHLLFECDFNNDRICNLKDFSILLYFYKPKV